MFPPPQLEITKSLTLDKQGTLEGFAKDESGIAEIIINGQSVNFDSSGGFMYQTFVPPDGKQLNIQVTDLTGSLTKRAIRLNRPEVEADLTIAFKELNPLGRKGKPKKDAIALIIGVETYSETPTKALFADSDAKAFADFASEKLGIPENRIKTLIGPDANERGLLLNLKNWLARSINPARSDVFIFFAGHGLASDDGKKMYLLPFDGSPELLEDTAISRNRLISDIAKANPLSVTLFLDTCYSGATRIERESLIASRPVMIKALDQSIPKGFTVLTAAAANQTAKPLKEAKQGMFSYFLMKGMEGDADANSDKKITTGELHKFVLDNVVQQSVGTQTPELQGDADKVIITFD